MHTRSKLRLEIARRLSAYTGLANVYTGRVQPTHASKMPFANVETRNESAQRHIDQWREMRTLQVYVHLYTTADEHMDDALDAISLDVENLLFGDQTMGGIVETFEYKGCELDAASAARVEDGALSLEFECRYLWEPAPPTDDLGQIHVDIDMSSPRNDPALPAVPDGQIDATDSITLPN